MRRAFGLLPALSALATGALAQSEIPPVVQKAISVQDKLRFAGRRVVAIRAEGETRSYEDLIVSDGKRFRIEYPQGAARHGEIVIDAGGQRHHYYPNENEVEQSPSVGDVYKPRIAGLKGPNVSFVAAGSETLAGRNCEIVTVTRNAGKGQMQLWIDPETGMVMKRQLLDGQGRIVSGFEFREISFNPQISPDAFTPNFGNARRVTTEDRIARMGTNFGFEPLRMPPALSLKATGGRMIGSIGRPIFAQTFSADRGRLTIFRTKGKINPKRLQQLAKGLRSLSWERNGQTIVLVGDIDESKFAEIARELGAP